MPETPVIAVNEIVPRGGHLAKRAVDVVLASLGLLVVSPALLILAIAIRLQSPGPALYRGKRVGRFGRPFEMLKLRTMVQDAERLGGSETASDDPRITRLGAVLRHYKLDELPQLVNVLRGEMSLVGPRPELSEDVALFTAREQQLLLSVQPGLTNWAAVKYPHEDEILRGCADPRLTYRQHILPDKIRLGIEYVQRRSLLVDFQILFGTAKALLFPPTKDSAKDCAVASRNE